MKIFNTGLIKYIDAGTIEVQNITSVQLMERAAEALYNSLIDLIDNKKSIQVFCGPGNNGGDAIALSGILMQNGYRVKTIVCDFSDKRSEDATYELNKLISAYPENTIILSDYNQISALPKTDYIIDGLFGSGLNRPLQGDYQKVVSWINKSESYKISIDISSGLFGEDNSTNNPASIVRADLVLTLQMPKLCFMLQENEAFIKDWKIVDIGLDRDIIKSMPTDFEFVQGEDLSVLLKVRPKFSHKGSYGKCLLIAGCKGMAGAAILASKAAVRGGAGLVYSRVPEELYNILQTSVNEAIVETYSNDCFYSNDDAVKWNAIAVGPGLGKSQNKTESLKKLLFTGSNNIVLDADAINMIAEDKTLLACMSSNAILTPHPGEYDRLRGKKFLNSFERLADAVEFAKDHSVFVILKGAYTSVITPEGKCFFNSTGNPGMATGGSGDVLTGILLSLLAQGYKIVDACLLAVYLHGLSGDIALNNQSQESLAAGDIIENLGLAFNTLRKL